MILVRHAMTGNPYSVKPNTLVRDAVDTMVYNGLETIIVTEGERILGAVTRQDVLRFMLHPAFQPDRVTVDEIADDDIILLRPNTTLYDAANIMTETGKDSLPVVDDKLVGYISLRDILTVQPNQDNKVTNYIM